MDVALLPNDEGPRDIEMSLAGLLLVLGISLLAHHFGWTALGIAVTIFGGSNFTAHYSWLRIPPCC